MTPRTPTLAATASADARQRLEHSRARIERWLAQDSPAVTAGSLFGCALSGAVPLLAELRQHPGTAVVLGALVQAWLRPPPGGASPRPAQPGPLDTAVALARRHPRATLLATVGLGGLASVALWWSNRHATPLQPHR